MSRLSILFFLLYFGFLSQAQVLQEAPLDEESTPTLLIFSGSDWCLPCIRLEKDVFSNHKFKEFASGKFQVLKADFPQRTKQSEELVSKNEALAERYNPNGQFPLVLFLAPNGDIKAKIPTESVSLEQMILDLSNLMIGDVKEYRHKALLMGSAFEFIVVANSAKGAEALHKIGKEEVIRLENLLSEWKSDTEVAQLNRKAGIEAVKVSDEVHRLTQRSLALSGLSQGAFDISFNGIDVYQFDKKKHSSFPDTNLIKSKLQNVGFDKIKLQSDGYIFLTDSGMSIGFGANGKGYAADEVKRIWQEKGVKSGVVNASGDLIAWGKRADGSSWRVGIADPENSEKVLFWIPVENQAVATSGSYEKYFEYNGERYAHIINPLTGYPITDKKSVTVISPSAELSDALATALFVLDKEVGLDLIRQLPQAECIIIDVDNEVYFSSKLKLIEQN